MRIVRPIATVVILAIFLFCRECSRFITIPAAIGIAYLIFSYGQKMLGGFSQPMAEPPPPGEMRKVKLEYRCDICGSEARMTMAPDEDPPAPRHCLDDMRLITPVE